MINYNQTQGAVKCKFFMLTLKGSTMTWFKVLLDGSINSWKELCDSFTAQIMVQNWKTITIVVLSGIH